MIPTILLVFVMYHTNYHLFDSIGNGFINLKMTYIHTGKFMQKHP